MRTSSLGRMMSVGAVGHPLRRAITSCVASAFLFVTSCTSYVRVPDSDGDIDSEKRLGWRVIAGDVMYDVDSLRVTETEVILEHVSSAYRDKKTQYHRYAKIKNLQTPLVLQRDEVTSIERAERAKLRSALALVGVLAGAVFVLYVYVAIRGFDTGT